MLLLLYFLLCFDDFFLGHDVDGCPLEIKGISFEFGIRKFLKGIFSELLGLELNDGDGFIGAEEDSGDNAIISKLLLDLALLSVVVQVLNEDYGFASLTQVSIGL